ncbi:ATP-dependent helicase HrpB [Pelagibacterium sp. 26DY04]|uniref:ATP-dependent helicase HrpB n=1 Tax=Pelagibacterium sp. 26DY04 TaxID=2967130 RepID=UPI002814BF96|nr:ATP-dependent helicase HrpB [Pelagibacterium sp. 26DY04]WMT87590.1 ATP-dependent helicase HrpB [Pelagibacterium sp. 26DY04]
MHPAAPLPIDAVLPQLADALASHTRAVLVAPPGAGKTTRVPLALLEAPWRGDGRIVMLEPRRLAARAAARRMAQTLGEEVGQTVGYRVRLDTKVSARTRIEVVTEGVFTRMILDDPELTGIAAVLFDEFHERSLDGDLGLALTLDATALREDLRILAMSATLDGAAVANLLGDAPVIESEGRAFPVETRHIVPDPNARIEQVVASATRRALSEEQGSALIFLPGQAEIRRTAEALATIVGPYTDIAPLYGQLTPAEQDRAIQPAPEGRRKIVLATAIAQTSLTIEGVRIVIDSGLSRLPVYEPDTGLTRLETRRVSRASADQRRGRAGRTEPGVCYRLWHEGQTASLIPFDPPEILQADLTGLVLDLAGWGVTDPATLGFLDPPPAPAWSEAVALLKSLDALDAGARITPHGTLLAKLPLHPRLGHMIALAAAEGTAMDAALLGVLVGEQGLGGTSTDLSARFDRLRRDTSRRATEAKSLAARWAKAAVSTRQPTPGVDRAVVGAGEVSGVDLGRHLARAYPDRVAQQTAPGRFRLANGRQARLDETDSLARAPFLVVADMTGSAASAVIRAAIPIDRATVEEVFAPHIETVIDLAFDPAPRAVRARRQRRYGALRLEDAPAAIDDPNAPKILAAGIAQLGIGKLPWSRDQRTLRDRATFLHQTLGQDWPDLSDTALAQNGAAWLVPHIAGLSRLDAITPDHLSAALFDLLPWDRRSEIDRLLPSHFDAPSGSRVPIDYATENGPVLAIRVQELFGLDQHPAIANGKIPLLLSLLSPAHRPIQTTSDLPGFWRGSWKDVAKDLKGRYPKHYWPDDPLSAQATNRAKPRG